MSPIDDKPHDVVLEINGVAIDTWDEYHFKSSMIDHGNPFTFTLWRSKESATAWDYLLENVKCEDPVTLRVDGALQLAGYIETIAGSASKNTGASIVVSGTDVAGLAMRWDVSPRANVINTELHSALEAIFEPFGLSVQVADGAATVITQSGRSHGNRSRSGTRRRQKIDKHRPEIGAKAWSAAEKLCRRVGYMLWSAPWDVDTIGIIVDKPAYSSQPLYQFVRRLVGESSQDSNILEGGPRISTAETPSEAFVYGQGDHGDGTPARVCAHATNNRLDTQFVRSPMRTKPVHARTVSGRGLRQAQQQADRVIDDAMMRHSTYSCTVKRHSQPWDGSDEIQLLYAINSTARVRDDVFRIDRTYLIDTIEGSRSRQNGTFTHINMHSLGAISLTPDPDA